MKLLLRILLIITFYNNVSCATEPWEEWQTFKKTYNKTYKNENEETYRQSVFFKTLQKIKHHNQRHSQGLEKFTIGINKLADQNLKEVQTPSYPGIPTSKPTKKLILNKEVPESIDWRDFGIIRPILDQDFCLSCWAFAVVAAIEAHLGIYSNDKNITLSQEHLIDCVYSDFECKQEMRRTALEDCYKYIITNGGIATDKAYPYDEITGQCRYKSDYFGAKIDDYGVVPEGDEEELKRVVGTLGPVAVIITVDHSFMLYRTGVYYKEDCNNTEEPYNHAVTIVGYGTEDGQDYWLVRNEWSVIFGDQGYIKMARNNGNMCGIATFASYPIINKIKDN